MDNSFRSRILGLDITRAIAILMVLGAHCSFFDRALNGFVPPAREAVYTLLGTLGVELFFTLSGFLIGGILLRDAFPTPSLKKTGKFFLRRWLRTLPAYYVVLSSLFFIDWLFTGEGIRWDYIFFLQNFDDGANNFFPVSWTLSIEQWSYLIAPIVIYILPKGIAKIKPDFEGPKSLFVALGIIFISFLLARIIAVTFSEPTWDTDIRKQIPLRLDAVFFGILISSIKIFYRNIYIKLSSSVYYICILFFVFLYSYSLYSNILYGTINNSFFHKTFGFTFCDFMLAFLIPFFDFNPIANNFLQKRIYFVSISQWLSMHAYSIYLIHFMIFLLMYKVFMFISEFIVHNNSVINLNFDNFLFFIWIFLVCIAFVTMFCLSICLFRYIEKPGMNIRRIIKE